MNTINERTVNEVTAIEVSPRYTVAIRLRVIGQAVVVEKCISEGPIFLMEGGRMKVHSQVVKKIVHGLGEGVKNVSLVVNMPSEVSFLQQTSIGTESSLRSEIHQAAQLSHKIDLTKYHWTVTPLAKDLDNKHRLKEAFSNKTSMLVSGARREHVEALRAAFRKEKCAVEQTLFPPVCLEKAFDFFSGNMLENETVVLCQSTESCFSLTLLKKNRILEHHIYPGDAAGLQTAQVLDAIGTLQQRCKSAIRCVFVSGETDLSERISSGLKAGGCYARTWNAIRKLSAAPELKQSGNYPEESYLFNAAAGAAMLVLEGQARADEEAAETALDEGIIAQKWVQLSAAAACLLGMLSGGLFFFNERLGQEIKASEGKLKKAQQTVSVREVPLESTKKRIRELEWFRESRRNWPQIAVDLIESNPWGLEIVQVKATDGLMLDDLNPFDSATTGALKRKNTGSLLIEARNHGGLSSLEALRDTLRENPRVWPILNRKNPFRFLNNIEASSGQPEAAAAALVTVECLLEERLF